MRWCTCLGLVMLVACSPPTVASLTLAPEVVELGTTGNCQVATAALTMTNTGDVPLTLEVSSGAPFVVTPSATTLAAGESGEVTVSFDSTDRLGDFERTFELWREGKVMATFTARVTVVVFDLEPLVLDFGGVKVGTTRTSLVEVMPAFEVLTSSEPAFAVTWDSSTRALFQFSPTEARAYAGAMRVKPTSGCEYGITLAGTGVDAELAWAPAVVGWSGDAGVPLSTTVVFSNSTRDRVEVRDVIVSAQGDVSGAPGFAHASSVSVPASVGDVAGTASLELRYTPSVAGVRTFTLRATTSLATQPQVAIPIRVEAQ